MTLQAMDIQLLPYYLHGSPSMPLRGPRGHAAGAEHGLAHLVSGNTTAATGKEDAAMALPP